MKHLTDAVTCRLSVADCLLEEAGRDERSLPDRIAMLAMAERMMDEIIALPKASAKAEQRRSTLDAISSRRERFWSALDQVLHKLKKKHVRLCRWNDLTEKQQQEASRWRERVCLAKDDSLDRLTELLPGYLFTVEQTADGFQVYVWKKECCLFQVA